MSNMPEFQAEYSDDFKRINVGGIFGGTRSSGVEATIYSEISDFSKALQSQQPNPALTIIKRKIECELIIDPQQLVSMHKWLGEKIKEYEKLFGHIPSPEEIQSRQGRQNPQQ